MILNKKVFLISPFLLAVSSFSMACKTDPKIEKIITKNGLEKTKVMSMYKNCTLSVSADTPNKVTLVNNKAANRDAEAKKAMYWYRGMGIKEYKAFHQNKYKSLPCVKGKSFCGIAPEYTYSQGYLTNSNPGVVVEFSTIEPSWLYNDFKIKHKCEYKAEGGGTYGLGVTGTSASCDSEYQRVGIGNVFNRWLSEKPAKIDVIISYVLLAK
ncbi:hypothetical protein CE143_15895 [Photorhabdus luminescens]|uniref:Lipoprotein n=2 Tax=Photorhabdus TaxID=29487 RepID=A0A022PLB3_9GAMM|nr:MULTISPECIES: hypothetical protein [Photorhabdus]PQQ30886.1 hypothetical protein C6H64_08650 [Photorhabdus luminescens]EYU16892.1 hypothetical protein BA1DRAFT_00543 [Photorhabdus aegyptia]MBS9429812.1 hypothetical protein [Photorhabdus akhurstii]PQQ35110.1 hypothetical protein C6H69_02610 [Photorhabdus luminescens]PQQ38809.1 hypothetical protein C6H65_20450 [Photorhabdus luminescens]